MGAAREDARVRGAGRLMIPVLMTGAFLGSLSQNMLASALAAIIDEFGVSALVGQWLTTVYLLMVGVVSARTATLFQRVRTRRLLECSLALFAVGCLASIVAPSFWTLLVARAIQSDSPLRYFVSARKIGLRMAVPWTMPSSSFTSLISTS